MEIAAGMVLTTALVAGMTILAYHMGRLWGAVGNLLYFSAGPDCINGDGNQAWPPANVFTMSAPIKALAAHLSKRFKLPWEFLNFPTGL